MKRRKKRSQLDRIVLGAAKMIRKQRLDFEREASKALSEALGFLVVVKIQKRSPTADLSPDMRRAHRKSPAEVKAMVLDQLRPMENGGASGDGLEDGVDQPPPPPRQRSRPKAGRPKPEATRS
jgi:hypothetical protein